MVAETAIAVRDRQFLEEPAEPRVEHREALAAGGLSQRTASHDLPRPVAPMMSRLCPARIQSTPATLAIARSSDRTHTIMAQGPGDLR